MNLNRLLIRIQTTATERGASAVEYALLVAGCGVALIGATEIFGQLIGAMFTASLPDPIEP